MINVLMFICHNKKNPKYSNPACRTRGWFFSHSWQPQRRPSAPEPRLCDRFHPPGEGWGGGWWGLQSGPVLTEWPLVTELAALGGLTQGHTHFSPFSTLPFSCPVRRPLECSCPHRLLLTPVLAVAAAGLLPALKIFIAQLSAPHLPGSEGGCWSATYLLLLRWP